MKARLQLNALLIKTSTNVQTTTETPTAMDSTITTMPTFEIVRFPDTSISEEKPTELALTPIDTTITNAKTTEKSTESTNIILATTETSNNETLPVNIQSTHSSTNKFAMESTNNILTTEVTTLKDSLTESSLSTNMITQGTIVLNLLREKNKRYSHQFMIRCTQNEKEFD